MGIRISEMEEATTFGADDYVPIVTSGTNKKALGQKIKDFIAGFFVSKSGDTMTGDLNTIASFANKYNGIEVDNSSTNHVSSNTQLTSVEFKDKNDFVYSGLNTTLSTNGLIETWLNVKNKKTDGSVVNNYIDLLVAKDGTKSYDVADPAAFRKAIGWRDSSKIINTTYGTLTLMKSGNIVTIRWQGNSTALPNDTVIYAGQTAIRSSATITFDVAVSQNKRGYIAITSSSTANGSVTATGLNDGSVTYTQGTMTYISSNYDAIV